MITVYKNRRTGEWICDVRGGTADSPSDSTWLFSWPTWEQAYGQASNIADDRRWLIAQAMDDKYSCGCITSTMQTAPTYDGGMYFGYVKDTSACPKASHKGRP